MGTAAVAHLDRKLLAVRVVVAIAATLRSELQVVPRSLSLMTTRATDGLMLAFEWELRSTMLFDGEQRGPEPMLVVATRAVGRAEAAAMDVPMAVPALLKLQASVPPLHRKLGRVAAFAHNLSVRSLEGKRRLRVSAKPDLLRQPEPTNAGVTVLASVPEHGLVDLGVTGHALRAHAGRGDVALIVTGLALRLRVTGGEAQPRMIPPNIGDFAPVGFIVARDALLPAKPVVVWILVTRGARGL